MSVNPVLSGPCADELVEYKYAGDSYAWRSLSSAEFGLLAATKKLLQPSSSDLVLCNPGAVQLFYPCRQAHVVPGRQQISCQRAVGWVSL
jgi:hypothetical protein